MARRSLAGSAGSFLMGSAGIALILLALIIIILRDYPFEVGAIVVAGFGVRHFWKRYNAGRRRLEMERGRACTDRQIERHAPALLSYFRQSISSDLFGNEDVSKWRRHVGTFLDTQVTPALRASSINVDPEMLEELARHVDAAVRSANGGAELAAENQDLDPAQLSDREYEQHCAAILFRGGWTVQPTPATGDHGADVVAEKDGQRLIVQCKLYAQPVGNKAVQEVYAARPLYAGDHACVVAPSGFTAQARRAAHALSVRLLHHSELRSFADELSAQSPREMGKAPGACQPLRPFEGSQRPQLLPVRLKRTRLPGSRNAS